VGAITVRLTEPAKSSTWHSSPARVARCLFCGNVGAHWDCCCPTAEAIRAGKAKFRLLSRGGEAVITECSPEVMRAIRLAGVLKISEPSTAYPPKLNRTTETEPPAPAAESETEPTPQAVCRGRRSCADVRRRSLYAARFCSPASLAEGVEGRAFDAFWTVCRIIRSRSTE
jgi:hypothetical protein